MRVYEKKPSYTRNATTGMLADLLGSMFVNAAYGLETATQAKQVFNANLSAALGGTGGDAATHPYAYLNYIVFDANYVVKDGGAWRVPTTAGFDPGMETAVNPQLVKFPSYIKPQQKGYIYIWVSNESENTKVWFDDLKVTHTKSRVIQASDYYAWGSTMREQRTPENDIYRYGYQGNFSEHDEETNWNHFELRQNDPIVGRWTTRDPKNAGFSPYWSMDNNPIIKTDPDGGCPGGCPGFWFRNAMGIKMNKSYGISIGMGLRSPKLDQLFGEFDRYNEKLGPLSINIGAEEFHGRVYLMNDHVAFEGNLFNADLGSYSFRGGDAYLRFDSQGFRNSDVNLFSLTTPTFEGVAYGEHIDRSLDVNIDAGPVDIGVKGPGLWKGFVQWIKNMVNEVITIDGPTLSRDE